MRPDLTQIDPYYHAYMKAVPEPTALDALAASRREMSEALSGFSSHLVDHRYEPGKWSVGEVLQHIADCERVFQYRALRFARADSLPLHGFDHDAWASIAAAGRSIADIGSELEAIRASSEAMFRSVTAETGRRVGTANGKVISVTALGYLIAGHARHHLHVIQSRYL